MTATAGPPQRCYAIHGLELVVSSEAPTALEALDRRLRSFRSAAGSAPPALRIEFLVRDEGAAGRLPARQEPGRPVYDAPGGEILYHDDTDTLSADVAGVRVECRAGDGVARIESADLTGRSLYLATHTLATVCLIELLKRRGLFNVHAACLAQRGAGVLLAGPSGAGKSTLAIALVRASMSFLSDDMVYLRRLDAGVHVLGFPDAVGVTEQTAERFPELDRAAYPPTAGFPKRLARMQSAFDVEQPPDCTPRVLIFPEVSRDGPSGLVACEPGEALLRLVPDMLLTCHAAAQAHLAALGALLSQVACYDLRSGPDLDASVELVLDLLR